MNKVRLTKKILNAFIMWSTSRYNSYLGFGTKKNNVDMVFNSLTYGHYFDGKKTDVAKKIFQIECSAGNGEGYNRHWRLKGSPGDYKYEINCTEKSILGIPSNNKIYFE